MPSYFPENNTALASDNEVRSLQKIVSLLAGGGSGGGAALYSGTGSPEGVVTAAVGSIYTDTSTAQVWTKVSGAGNTGWGP